MNKRLTKQDWLDLGLQAIAEKGPDGLTVEALCKRSCKTKGSFYHHFASAPDFIRQLLKWWVKKYTLDIIEKTENLKRPRKKLEHLNFLAAHLDSQVEQGFRRLAAQNSDAADRCRFVDITRINYLAKLYQQSSSYRLDETLTLAKVEYAAWVGFQLVFPEADVAEMLVLFDALIAKKQTRQRNLKKQT